MKELKEKYDELKSSYEHIKFLMSNFENKLNEFGNILNQDKSSIETPTTKSPQSMPTYNIPKETHKNDFMRNRSPYRTNESEWMEVGTDGTQTMPNFVV